MINIFDPKQQLDKSGDNLDSMTEIADRLMPYLSIVFFLQNPGCFDSSIIFILSSFVKRFLSGVGGIFYQNL